MDSSVKKTTGKTISYDKLTEGWFSARKILSYNRHLMAITGKRSTGKSTGVALFLLMEYRRTGQGWIYTRRTKDETQLTCADWFNNACDILNGYIETECHVLYKGGFYYYVEGSLETVDDEGNTVPRKDLYEKVCGRAIPLSQQQKYKGSNFSAFDWIVYDEFIAFEGGSPYLGGYSNPLQEYRMLMSLFETADRGIGIAHRNAVKIFCLGNNDSYYNPIYTAIGADKFLRSDTKILAPKDEEWIVQQLTAEDAPMAEDYKNSVGYKLADARTKEYAYENMNKEQGDSQFVCKLKVTMHPVFNASFDGYKMAVYQYSQGFYVVAGTAPGVHNYALTMKDHTPDRTLTYGAYGFTLQQFKKNYSDGFVRFENMKCKVCFDSYFKFIQ